MADDTQQKLTIAISAIDQASAIFKSLAANVAEAGGQITNSNQQSGNSFATLVASIFTAQAAYGLLMTGLRDVKGFFEDSIGAAFDVSKTMVQVQVDVKNAGLSYASVGPQIDALAKKNETLGFTQEETQLSMGKAILSTHSYSEAVQLNSLAMDLSVAKNISLDEATLKLNQAMAGNTRILKEYGISLDSASTSADVLNTVQEQVGGSAAALEGTPAGALREIKAQWAGIKDEVGNQLLPVIEQLMQEFERNLPEIENLVIGGAGAMEKFAEAVLAVTPVIVDLTIATAAFFATMGVGATIAAVDSIIIDLQASMLAATTVTEGMTLAWVNLDAAMDANPLGALAIVIGIVAVAVKEGIDAFNNYKKAEKEQEDESTKLIANLTQLADAYNKVHTSAQTSVFDLATQGYGSAKTAEATKDLEAEYTNLDNKLKDGTISQKEFDDQSKGIVSTLTDLGVKIYSATDNFDEFGNRIPKAAAAASKSVSDAEKVIVKHADAVAKLGTEYDKFQAQANTDLNELKDTWADKATTIQDTITKMQKGIADLQKSYDDQKTSDTASVADKIVASEQKIADIKKQLSESTSASQTENLNEQLATEQANYDSSLAYRQANTAAMAEAERRAGETDLQRTIEDYNTKEAKDKEAFDSQMKNQLDALNDFVNKSMQEVLVAQIKVLTIQVAQTAAHNVFIQQSNARADQTTKEVDSEVADYTRATQALNQLKSAQGAAAVQGASNNAGSIFTSSPYKSVNDAIITPQGVVKTAPDDFIIATKNPASLGGGGDGGVTINIINPTVRKNGDIDDMRKSVEQVFRSVLINHKIVHI
jgi:hypothetical protein